MDEFDALKQLAVDQGSELEAIALRVSDLNLGRAEQARLQLEAAQRQVGCFYDRTLLKLCRACIQQSLASYFSTHR